MSEMLNTIIKIIKEKTDIAVISFDLFDTILFRMVKEPVDVFYKVGEKALQAGILPNHITPEIYKNIRIEAEKRARQIKLKKECHTEVTLKEILEYIPKIVCKEKNILFHLELETEQELCYLNPDMEKVFPFLMKWKENGKKIIITSDMYLSAEQEKKLLENNHIDTKLLDFVFVSSECFCTKAEGSLYSYVIKKLKLKPENLLHIGDNYITDIVNAQYHGIQTYYYDIISTNQYMLFQMEQIKYGDLLPEINSLRKYVGSKSKKLKKEQNFWFKTGAMIFGPLITGVTEWVLDTAKKEKIFDIFPLMREGMFLSKLLKQAVSFRKEKYRIQPLYISRKSVFLPSLTTWNEEAFEKVLLIKKASIETLFQMLKINLEKFKQYKDIKLTEVNYIQENYITLKEKLKEYLFSENIIKSINDTIEQEKNKFKKYIKQVKPSHRFITFDLGVKGTIQNSLFHLLGEQYDMLHLLIFGAKENTEKIIMGLDIRGYVGNAGSNEDLVFDVILRPQIWEQIMMCDLGTTIGYTEDGKPIIKKITAISKEHYQKIAWCQEGILAFQREYLKLKKQKKKIYLIERKVRNTTNLIFRMITMPTLEEAKKLGTLQFDENFGVDCVESLCPKEKLEELKKLGIEEWLAKNRKGEVKWKEGLITMISPMYYFDKEIQKNISDYKNSILQIVKQVVKKKPRQVIICGAGEAGRMMKQYLEWYGISIESFTDANIKLQGTKIESIPVKTLQDNFQSEHYVIASFAYAKEIKNQIQTIKGTDVIIYWEES